MQLQDAELFYGLRIATLDGLMRLAETTHRRRGDRLFALDAPAERFYILQRGAVVLEYGPERTRVYEGRSPGALFGWSAIVGRASYSASAICTETSRLSGINRDAFWALLRRDPGEELTFCRQLVVVLGHRLIESYRLIGALPETLTVRVTGAATDLQRK